MAVTRREISGMYKPYLVQAIALEQAVQDLLDRWEQVNNGIILTHSSSSGIKNIQEMTNELLEAVTLFLIQYGELMDSGIGKIADVKAQQVLNESLPLLRAVGDSEGAAYFRRDMETFSNHMIGTWALIGIGLYAVTFRQRQAAIELSTKKTVNNIITLATKEKLGGQDIQKILKDYINPNTTPGKPWDIARKALGASKKYVPKDVLSGSVQTNLYETTRNQASDIWRDMTEQAYEGAEWVNGYDWVLS